MATVSAGAALDARIAALEDENAKLRAALHNGFLLVNRPAESFLSAELWSRQVCATLGVDGVQGFAHFIRPSPPTMWRGHNATQNWMYVRGDTVKLRS